jgi:gamma-glutamyltranspeptidase/glutathione hydrolase
MRALFSGPFGVVGLSLFALAACVAKGTTLIQEQDGALPEAMAPTPEASTEVGSPTAARQTATLFQHAAVAADHPLASQIGVDMLQEGGNAVDAAVATALVLGVVNPFASGIGGGGFAVVRFADGTPPVALDFREVAPAGATVDMFQPTNGEAPSSTLGGLAVAVPGEAMGLWTLHDTYGALPWATVVEPALELARDGFEAGTLLVQRLENSPNLDSQPAFFSAWMPERQLPAQGQLITLHDYARFLERYQTLGPDGFYGGEVAQDIVQSVRQAGGILTLDDLSGYQAEWRAPLQFVWRDLTLITMPPVSSGGVVLQQVLTALGDDEPPGLWASTSLFHRLCLLYGFAFADRALRLGDPAFVELQLEPMLGAARLTEIRAALDSPTALPTEAFGALVAPTQDDGTSHISIVDEQGMAVALTTTINTAFGAHVRTGEFGIVLNNEMDDFSASPGVPNAFGLVGSFANRIEPGKRPLSSMTPTIVERNGQVQGVVGASGGPQIITGTLSVLLQLEWFGATTDAAVRAPRMHFQWLPPTVFLEDSAALAELSALGWSTQQASFGSAVQAIWRYNGQWNATSDPRKHGLAAGY